MAGVGRFTHGRSHVVEVRGDVLRMGGGRLSEAPSPLCERTHAPMSEVNHTHSRGPRPGWVWLLVAIGVVLIVGGIIVAVTT